MVGNAADRVIALMVTSGLGIELIKVVDFWYNVSPERMMITNN